MFQVRNFMQWTQSNEKTAIHCLSSQNWNLELACDAYYQNPQLYMCMADVVDQRSLHAFFLKYANSIVLRSICIVEIAYNELFILPLTISL